MHRDSTSKRLAWWLSVVALAIASAGLVQAAQPEADAAATAALAAESDEALPSESPRRTRERRRNAQAATDTAEATTAAAPATPQTAAAATLAEPPTETVETKIVCKNRKPLGSRMARRVCGTPEQWAAVGEATSDDAQETMRQMRDQSRVIATQPDNPLSTTN